MNTLRKLASYKAARFGYPHAIVNRPHGLSLLPLHLCRNLEILEKIGA